MGGTVAMIGDSLSDAKAIRYATVGIAMGCSCELTKESADVVLLDNNFRSAILAIQWGRNLYGNIRKFLQFQLTVNLSALTLVFLSGMIIGDSPLTVIQLLWINMIMDTFAALAFATEPPIQKLVSSKPIQLKESFIQPAVLRAILTQYAYQMLALLILLFLGPLMFNLEYNLWDSSRFGNGGVPTDKEVLYTIIFNTFVFLQIFNFINCRKVGAEDINVFESFFHNWSFLGIFLGTTLGQMAIVEIGGKLFMTTSLTWPQHLVCVCVGASSLLISLAVKYTPLTWAQNLSKHIKEEQPENEGMASMLLHKGKDEDSDLFRSE